MFELKDAPKVSAQQKTPKEKIDVKLTTGGIYLMTPMMAEYKKFDSYEAISVRFKLNLSMSLDCWVGKTIFFKDQNALNEEVKYILKFIAPELLEKTYKATSFEEYAKELCKDINKSLSDSRSNKNFTTLLGKLIRKKDSKYVEFESHIPASGDYRKEYLAQLHEYNKLYFSNWELDNCVVPFERDERASNKNSSLDSVLDDLPF